MKRFSLNELKLAIDAGCDQFGDDEMIIVGSLSLLGHAKGELPDAIQTTMDIDLYPKNVPTEKNLDTARMALDYGEGSKFRQEHGWYIEVMGTWVTDRATGWQDRTNPVTTERGNVGHCISPLDLAFIKATVGREKDYKQVKDMIGVGYLSYGDLKKFITDFPPPLELQREKASEFIVKLQGMLNETPLLEIPRVPTKGEHFYPTGAGKTGYATK